MSTSADQNANSDVLDDLAVTNFREYLRIPSVHPDVNYEGCVKFLEKQAKDLGLPLTVYSKFPSKPIVVITWVGQEPASPSILLNSHMDVVPVFEEKWTHPPFSAHMDENGIIYARGSQDMKCVGIQYLEAVRRLKLKGVTFRRTIHISFVPDEEIGGVDGMRWFVTTKDFQKLNVGVALDEGMASPNKEYVLFNGERCIWHLRITCPGQPGHGSLLLEDTAGEKLRRLLDSFFAFREQEKKRLEDNPLLTIGDVTTLNLTQIEGGVQENVVPPELVAVFDCRIPVTVDMKKWEQTVNEWCKEAGEGVTIEYTRKERQIPVTKLDATNPYWVAFKKASDDLGFKLKPQIFPGGTDSRFIRELGIPALGFSPMNDTPVLLHDHDEFLSTSTFLRGVQAYISLISAVASVEDRSG